MITREQKVTTARKWPTRPGSSAAYAYRKYQDVRKQVPFTNATLALPYNVNVWNMRWQNIGGSLDYLDAASTVWQTKDYFRDGFVGPDAYSNSGRLAYNKAYSKLRARVSEKSADLLTLIRERKQLGEMLFRRLHQMGDLVDEARNYCSARGNTSKRAALHRQKSLRRIGAILATTPQGVRLKTPSLRNRQGLLTTPAELILELRWGWMPVVSDVYNAIDGISAPVPSMPFWAAGGYPIDETRRVQSGTQRLYQRVNGMFRVKIGGELLITSELTYALERVGLSNPAQSLYETLPYSWLIDYFTSVGEIVSSWDDRLIGKMTNVYVTSFCKGKERVTYDNPPWTGMKELWDFERERVHMSRVTPSSVPLPSLAFEFGLSPWRLATLASLVVLKIKRVKALGL